ncbi:conserved hypothetical protein [Candidatus Koribacter versatilis Ellin345]|uniref:SnoaL-like domain-containing protein n=1 Tax=Koribacter versatilis (strain Ellin345) TaxID=204669 RepID=Q1IJ26_KORVE|nr:nuclear transport factor 2 family protein [Candidatus Koribacter versatilis]ABF43124.1 conserved hypothetical protein [Candidatus Koribacter versatilis Ellin345]
MTREQAHEFATQWAAAWNRRDVEAVLAHFADDVEFISPKAQQFVGRSVLKGKAELRNYWETALKQINDIRFTLDSVFVGPGEREIAVLYTSRLNGRASRAMEIMRFHEDGLIVRGEAMYGVTIE